MRGYQTVIEKHEISDKLFYTISLSMDESKVFLKIDMNHGKFIIERIFDNNHLGLNDLAKETEKFNTEEKVLNYLGIGEKKDE